MKINLKELSTKYDNIAVVIHTRPDGDAIGSAIGLYHGFSMVGKEIDLLCDMEIPRKMSFLYGTDKFKTTVEKKYDFVIFSDCGDPSRVGNIDMDWRSTKTMCIDHHQSSTNFCDIPNVDPSSASTCQLVLDILEDNQIEITPDVANCLYAGLMTDTGNFSHTNATAKAFSDASKLCNYGACPNVLNRRIFKLMEGNKIKLLGNTMSNLKFFEDGRVAFFYMSLELLEKLEVGSSASEGLIDFALSVENVQIAIAVMQSADKTFKVSLRSISDIEVNRVAEHFGGGGHKQAAGCTLNGYYEDVKDKLIRQASFYTI